MSLVSMFIVLSISEYGFDFAEIFIFMESLNFLLHGVIDTAE